MLPISIIHGLACNINKVYHRLFAFTLGIAKGANKRVTNTKKRVPYPERRNLRWPAGYHLVCTYHTIPTTMVQPCMVLYYGSTIRNGKHYQAAS